MALSDKVKRSTKGTKREKFIRYKMWVSYLVSMIAKDRGKIPPNLTGDKILISNNMYITKLYMSSIIQITYLSIDTPVTVMGMITEAVRAKGSKAIVDFTFKNTKFDVKLKDSGLTSRIQMWENGLQSDMISDAKKERYARLLYTVDEVRAGEHLMKTRLFVTVRAKTGSELVRAENAIYKYLGTIGAEYRIISSGVRDILEYASILSDSKSQSSKDLIALVNSEKTLSQMLANCSSINDRKGLYLGMNILNNTPYIIDLSSITSGRNFYVIAPTGEGKTVLVLNFAHSGLEDGMAVCMMDIKGNEFTNFTRSAGGYIVSLHQQGSEYLNSFKMYKEDTTDSKAEIYFKDRVNFSKKQFSILSGITDQDMLNDLSELLDEFFNTMYITLGVSPTNRNSWDETLELTPYVVYDRLLEYITPEIRAKYPEMVRKALSAFRAYMSPEGNKNYIFRKEFERLDIMKAPVLTFDFGITNGDFNDIDINLFRLKFAYMQKLNAEYISYKYDHGIDTMKILEESQVVNDELMLAYVEEFTIRRAQRQTTLLLGNSIHALTNKAISAPIIENTKALLIGKLNKEARDTVIKQFDLQEHEELLSRIGSDEEYSNSFLFINKMEKDPLVPVLKVILDRNKRYKLYTPSKNSQE